MKDLIKKILREEIENDYSWVYDELNQEDPLEPVKEFIFNELRDCKLIPSEKGIGWTKYVDVNRDVLFTDNIDTGDYPFLFVKTDIWLKCKEMGCSWEDFQKICIDMLYFLYGRKTYRTMRLSKIDMV